MRRFRTNWVSSLVLDTRGAEIAEAAAVLPLMFMVLLGIFWFGQAFSIHGAITRAAQEGARAGAAPNCTTCSSTNSTTNVINAITAVLQAAGLDPTQAQAPATPPTFTACPTGSGSMVWSGSSSNFNIQAPVQLPNTATGVCGVSVSFQYPFQFWLPFTPLNKQKIWLSASARMRLENQ